MSLREKGPTAPAVEWAKALAAECYSCRGKGMSPRSRRLWVDTTLDAEYASRHERAAELGVPVENIERQISGLRGSWQDDN